MNDPGRMLRLNIDAKLSGPTWIWIEKLYNKNVKNTAPNMAQELRKVVDKH